jgi:hypothetical protein
MRLSFSRRESEKSRLRSQRHNSDALTTRTREQNVERRREVIFEALLASPPEL